MRKKVFGKRFKRDVNERKALFKGLMSSLVLYGSIKTTMAKAKAIKGSVDKLVTNALSHEGNVSKNLTARYLSHDAQQKFLRVLVPSLSKRPGGYTRLFKLGKRLKDDSEMVLMEWVDEHARVNTINLKKSSNPEKKGKTAKTPETLEGEIVTEKKALSSGKTKKVKAEKKPKKETK